MNFPILEFSCVWLELFHLCTIYSPLQIRVVNAFQMDFDTSQLDSYDKRSRPSVISLQSLQSAQQRSAVAKKPNLASSPEIDEGNSRGPWFGRQDSIPYADE